MSILLRLEPDHEQQPRVRWALIRHAAATGNIQADARQHISELHRMSGGNRGFSKNC